MSQQRFVPGRVLEITLEPRSCWDFNLRKELGEAAWEALERAATCDTGGRCDVCGAMPAELQPRWRYSDSKAVRTLVGFELLCPLCYWGRHPGHAGAVLALDEYEAVLGHLQRLNGYSDLELLQALDSAFAEFHRRTLMTPFKSDLGLFAAFQEVGR